MLFYLMWDTFDGGIRDGGKHEDNIPFSVDAFGRGTLAAALSAESPGKSDVPWLHMSGQVRSLSQRLIHPLRRSFSFGLPGGQP